MVQEKELSDEIECVVEEGGVCSNDKMGDEGEGKAKGERGEKEPVGSPEGPRDQQKKKLCKFGRNCDKKSTCEFSHEIINKPCRFGDRCNKKDACLFLHEQNHDQFGRSGDVDRRNWGDFEESNRSKGYVNDAFGMSRPSWGGVPNFGVTNPPGFGSMSRFGVSSPPNFGGVPNFVVPNGTGYDGASAQLGQARNGGGFGQISPFNSSGPQAGGGANRMCRDGVKCSMMDKCQFSHKKVPKECKFGDERKWVEKCPFLHSRNNSQGEELNQMGLNSKNSGGRA